MTHFTTGDWLMIATLAFAVIGQLIFVVWRIATMAATIESDRKASKAAWSALNGRLIVQEGHKVSERLAVVETSLTGIEGSLKRIETLLEKK